MCRRTRTGASASIYLFFNEKIVYVTSIRIDFNHFTSLKIQNLIAINLTVQLSSKFAYILCVAAPSRASPRWLSLVPSLAPRTQRTATASAAAGSFIIMPKAFQ